MAKKSRPSFDAPKPTGAGAAGWVYKSNAEPAAETPVEIVVKKRSVIDRALMPFALLLMTALAPVSWLCGPSKDRR